MEKKLGEDLKNENKTNRDYSFTVQIQARDAYSTIPVKSCWGNRSKEYERGLDDIESFSHLILIYKFHRSRGFSLKVKPIMDNRLRGFFATRAPRRPNQIGLSVVKFILRRGNILFVNGIDVIDGTPLLDIKPYVPDFNSGEEVRTCWIAGRTQ